MNCAEFEAQLQHLLDERTPLVELPSPLREAAANDPACAQILQAYQALEAALKARSLPQSPSGLAAKVITGLAKADNSGGLDEFSVRASGQSAAQQGSQVTSVRPGRMWLWSAAAVAASLLIAVVFLAGRQRIEPGVPGPVANQPHNAANQARQNDVASVPPRQDDDSLPRDQQLLPHDGSQASLTAFASLSELAQRQYESLAAETRAGLSDVAVLVPSYELGSVAVVEAPTVEEADVSVDRLRPFKESTRGAVGLLMRFTPR